MPGPGSRFTLKEDRLAKQVARSYRKKGYSKKRAMSIGYATVNRMKRRHGKRRNARYGI